jgi:hypothetical protein
MPPAQKVTLGEIATLIVIMRDELGPYRHTGDALSPSSCTQKRTDHAARYAAANYDWPDDLTAEVKAALFWRCGFAIYAVRRSRCRLSNIPEEVVPIVIESLLTEEWDKRGIEWVKGHFFPNSQTDPLRKINRLLERLPHN